MLVEKAIVILENEVRVAEVNDRPSEMKALQLGIEALDAIATWRRARSDNSLMRLPSETKEG